MSTATLVPSDAIETTINAFLRLDRRQDRKGMNKIAQRLQREQPFILQYGAKLQSEFGATTGEAGVFYMTLIWSMFDRSVTATLPRVTEANLQAAVDEVKKAWATVPGLAEKPVHERVVPALAERQPTIYKKLSELLEEDIRESAMTPETANAIVMPIQVTIEALDAALSGRRAGEAQGTIVRAEPTPGRNDICPCGSGKKYKKCHGA